jgi:hypothetical protein
MLIFGTISFLADLVEPRLVAFILGAASGAYILGADAFGLSAKRLFGLAVVDNLTGVRCSWFQSTVRNLPWWIGPFAKDVWGTDVNSRGLIAFGTLIIILTLGRKLGDGLGRHWADQIACTAVQPKTHVTKSEQRILNEDDGSKEPISSQLHS